LNLNFFIILTKIPPELNLNPNLTIIVTSSIINATIISQRWQGYYGNVSGAIQLANSNGNILYNWSIATVGGEIYVANVSSGLQWNSIACFDLYTNSTVMETNFNVSSSAVDGLNETFNLNDHTGFTTAGTNFVSGACNNTKLFNNAGVGAFDEVLLSDGTHQNLVYAALLKTDLTGFDGSTHDFEMIVLENGASGAGTATTYYFYAELE